MKLRQQILTIIVTAAVTLLATVVAEAYVIPAITHRAAAFSCVVMEGAVEGGPNYRLLLTTLQNTGNAVAEEIVFRVGTSRGILLGDVVTPLGENPAVEVGERQLTLMNLSLQSGEAVVIPLLLENATADDLAFRLRANGLSEQRIICDASDRS